jgi:hypothetical protein
MKKTITILAVLLLLSTTTAFAAEYPSQVSYNLYNGIFEVRKTYEMQVDEEPSAQAKQSFEHVGYSFVLTDMLRQELPEQQSKEYTETVTVNSGSKELTAILPLLADTKEITTEDGFTGTLKLDTSTITVEPAGYKNNSWTVSATRTYPNLSSMDLEYIPKTTTENGRTLNFSTVDWQTDNTETVDDDTIGDRFSAVVTYTGTASSRNVTGYTVTAQYSGEVEKVSLDKVQYVAVFHGTPIAPQEVEEAPVMDWRYLAILGGLVLLCLAGFIVAKIKNKKKGQNEDETIYDADYQVVKSGKDAGTDAGGSDSDEHYPGVSS